MQITDYPILNKFFGGDDLLIFSLFSLFCSLIAWPIIGFNLPPPQDKGGKASAKFGMAIGFSNAVGNGFVFLYRRILN